jgi:hypothetical protein
MVQEYTSRDMTYQSDKLPALSGVISALQQLTGDICYAGIWRSWFILGLLWRMQKPDKDLYVFVPKHAFKVDFWRAPSWSFAAIEGVARYNIVQAVPYDKEVAELELCSLTPTGRNPLGELKSGYANIKGPLTSLDAIPHDPHDHLSNGKACEVRLTGQRRVVAGVHFDLEDYDSCEVLMLTTFAGLAIRSVDVSKRTYVRVGVIQIYAGRGLSHDSGEPIVVDWKQGLTALHFPPPASITLL